MLNTESFLDDVRKKYQNFAEDGFYILIGVDSNGVPNILRDFEGDILKYSNYEQAESMQVILNMGHLAHYYIERII